MSERRRIEKPEVGTRYTIEFGDSDSSCSVDSVLLGITRTIKGMVHVEFKGGELTIDDMANFTSLRFYQDE